MIEYILLAVIQGITEFLPISSSGHLALISNLISEPNLFFMVAMHVASFFAILIYFRKNLYILSNIKNKDNWNWYKIIIIGIIPAGLIGFFFSDLIDKALNNYFFIGTGFLFTTLLLLSTKLKNGKRTRIKFLDSLYIGISQVFALFPGISRSGTTTSVGILRGIRAEEAGYFSFIMFIPLMIGAIILEINKFYFDWMLFISFIICFVVSLLSLRIFFKILENKKLWMFAVWTAVVSLISFSLGLFG